MFLFVPIVVTVLIICLIILTVYTVGWWKSNHGVVQRQIAEGVVTTTTGGDATAQQRQIEALVTDYAREILIDDYLQATSPISRVLEDNVKELVEETAVDALRDKVNALSALAVDVIKERTEPDKILALLGITETMTDGYVNDYVARYRNSLNSMDIDSLAKTAAEKVSGAYIQRYFGDKTAYVTTYIQSANELNEGIEEPVTLIRDMFVCDFDPSAPSETQSIENVLSTPSDVLILTEGGATGLRLTLSPTPTKPITYGLFLSKDTAYAINENEWSLKPPNGSVIDIQLNFFGEESTPSGNVEACIIAVE